MAIFHLTAKVISRGKGQNAVASAAYRSGKALTDHRTGEVKDFSRREHAVVFEGIYAPKDAPDWARDREQLWNRVEQFENRKDARLAREIELALPHEMTDQQRQWLVQDFVRENFVRKGYAVDAAIHAPSREGDDRNHHAHLMITTRQLSAEGFEPIKDRSMNSHEQLLEWREKWADLTNRHLERHGIEASVDHRSNEDRGIEAEPTQHEGPAVTNLARRKGEITDRRRENDELRERNVVRSADSQAHDLDNSQAEPVPLHAPTILRADPARIEELRRAREERSRQEAIEDERRAGIDNAGGGDWTSRGGMVAQQEEAFEHTDKGRMQREVTNEAARQRRAEKREQLREEARTEKAEAYFRDRIEPQRIERPSEERAAEQIEKPSRDPAQKNAPDLPRGYYPYGSVIGWSPPGRESEQHRREESRREAAAEPTAQRDGPQGERTEAQVQRESRKSGYELTERQRQILEAARGRNDVGRDQDGGRERD